MREITIGAIALQKSNEQGGFLIMLLSKGPKINKYQWIEILVS